MSERPVFYYDLSSPYAYLAALRVDSVLPVAPLWQPIAFGALLARLRRRPWSLTPGEREAGMASVEQRAARRGLPPVRWPPGWPAESYSLAAPRAVLHAPEGEQRRTLSHELFRLAFAEGRVLDLETLEEAAARTGLDAEELRGALASAELKERLRQATDEAFQRGVSGVPTVAVGDQLFWGDDRLEDAAAAAAAMA